MEQIEEYKEVEEVEEVEEKKCVSIQGTNTRYHMKKAMKIPKEITTKKYSNEYPEDYFSHETQLNLLKSEQREKYTNTNIHEPIQLKIAGYKQQDKKKGVWKEEDFISLEYVIEQLISCEIKCFYCKEPIYYLYKNTRYPKQWTIDRINNDIGHNVGNIVISCLECNLSRRRKDKDAYLFTKQLNIVKV